MQWPYEYNNDKLGQRQSQTPFSSAFWVQKIFGTKQFWVQKYFKTEKNVAQKNFGSKKTWVQRYFLTENIFESEKIFRSMIFGAISFGSK